MADSKYSVLDTSMMDDDGLGTYRFDREQHARILLDNLNSMQASEGKSKPLLTDINVCSLDEVAVVPFHRVVLAACSSTLQDTLTSKIFAKYTIGEFVIPEVTSAGVNILHDFAYGRNVTVTGDNVDEAMKLAELYAIDDLESACKSYEEDHSFEDLERASDVLDAIKEMWQAEQLTDLVLQDENQETELHCHKCCLAAASSQFRDLLQSNHIKRQSAIPIKDLSTEGLNSLIGYIYTAEVTIDSENVQELFVNSCYFLLPDIVKAACDWLERFLTTENAICVLELAQFVQSDQESVARLKETAFKFIVENFSDIVERSDEFVTMSLDDLTQVITEDELAVKSEEEVYHAVMKWVKHDEKRRLDSLPQLLKCIRLEDTTNDFLELVEQDPLIQKSPACFDIIEAARTAVNSLPLTKGARSVDDSFGSKSLPTSFSVKEDLLEQQNWESEDDYVNEEKQADANGQSDTSNNRTPDKGIRKKPPVPRKLVFGENPRRKNGQFDMRFKVNRERLLGKALNKDGSLDKRTRLYKDFVASMEPTPSETKPKIYVPLTKLGNPDMRFSINKRIFKKGSTNQRTSNSTAPGPLKKDGTPDMRFAGNKVTATPHSSSAATATNQSLPGPRKKDGTLDMRYAANKASTSCYSSAPTLKSSSYSLASLTRDGSSRSSFAPQVPSHSAYPSGPLKKNGTPDMRYAANRSFDSSSSSRSCGYSSYAANRSFDSSSSSRSCGNSSYGASSFTPSGPLKKDGTPDMRYKANKR